MSRETVSMEGLIEEKLVSNNEGSVEKRKLKDETIERFANLESYIEKNLPLMREGAEKIKAGERKLGYYPMNSCGLFGPDDVMEKAEKFVLEMKEIMAKARDAGKLGRENCEMLDMCRESFEECAYALNPESYTSYTQYNS